jgi:hypothetical protein
MTAAQSAPARRRGPRRKAPAHRGKNALGAHAKDIGQRPTLDLDTFLDDAA